MKPLLAAIGLGLLSGAVAIGLTLAYYIATTK